MIAMHAPVSCAALVGCLLVVVPACSKGTAQLAPAHDSAAAAGAVATATTPAAAQPPPAATAAASAAAAPATAPAAASAAAPTGALQAEAKALYAQRCSLCSRCRLCRNAPPRKLVPRHAQIVRMFSS